MRRRRRKNPLSPEPLEKRTLLAAATINFNDVRQTVDGFGSESAYIANPTTTAIQQAYSVANGIGLTFLRGSINQDGSTHQEVMMKQAAAYGVKLIMSARAAPSEWIANYNTKDGGYLLPSRYQDYANLLADSMEKWSAAGIPVYAMDFAVEPDLATTSPYTYMVWSEQQFADVLPVVANTFRARGITTKIMLPESFRWDFSLANQIMGDPALSQYVDALAAHGYDQTDFPYAPVTNAQGRPVWMTEYILNSNSQTATQNAVALASDIHEAFTVANASAYLYFWMSDGTTNGAYLMTNWTPNKRFWAMGNYSKFVRPGWVRVGESDDGGVELTTFKDPASGITGGFHLTWTINSAVSSTMARASVPRLLVTMAMAWLTVYARLLSLRARQTDRSRGRGERQAGNHAQPVVTIPAVHHRPLAPRRPGATHQRLQHQTRS